MLLLCAAGCYVHTYHTFDIESIIMGKVMPVKTIPHLACIMICDFIRDTKPMPKGAAWIQIRYFQRGFKGPFGPFLINLLINIHKLALCKLASLRQAQSADLNLLSPALMGFY